MRVGNNFSCVFCVKGAPLSPEAVFLSACVSKQSVHCQTLPAYLDVVATGGFTDTSRWAAAGITRVATKCMHRVGRVSVSLKIRLRHLHRGTSLILFCHEAWPACLYEHFCCESQSSLSLFNQQTPDMGSKMSFGRGGGDQNTVSDLSAVASRPCSSSSDCTQVASQEEM